MITGLRTAEPELLAHEGLHPGPPPPGAQRGRGGWSRRRWGLILMAALAWSLARSGLGRGEVVNPGGWEMVGRFASAATRPELGTEFLRLTLDGALTTLSFAVLGTALSLGLGLVLGVLGSEVWWGWRGGGIGIGIGIGSGRRGAWFVVRALLSLPRGAHEVVWGLFLVTVLGLDPLVGILAIGIPYGMVTAKVFSELLDETPRQGFEALRRAGAGRLQSILYSLAAQARGDMVSYAFYRFECSIRAAAILGIIGAGGLGFQLALSFQSLRYREMWTLIYALVLLCGAADLWSNRLRRRGREGRPAGPDRLLQWSVAAMVGLVVVATVHLAPDLSALWSSRARRLLGQVASAAWPPDLGLAQLVTLLRLSLETIEMAVVATALASTLGLGVAVVAANRTGRWGSRAAGAAARAVLLFCRAIPPPVGALVLLFVLFPGPLPGAVALGLYNFGILGRLMAEVVENLDSRPARGLRLQGASGPQALLYAVMPATLPRFVAYSLYRWEVTVRETVVVGLVGAGGLGGLLSQQLAAFDYRGLLATLLALVLLTFFGDLVGGAVRRSLR